MNVLGLAATLFLLFGYPGMTAAQGPAPLPPAALKAAAQVTGTAFYRERIALPAGAVFEARIEDVSEADAMAGVTGRVVLPDPGNPPFEFAIDYDPTQIDPRGRYVVRARVTVGDNLVFTSDTAHPVITGGAPNEVELLMRMVAAPTSSETPQPAAPGSLKFPATLAGTLSCPDCPTGSYLINLWPDGVFHLSRTTTDGGMPEDQIGRWSADARRPNLVLRSDQEVWRFAVVEPDRLRLLGRDGAPLAGADPATTDLRVQAFEPLEVSLPLRGMMRFEGGAARFHECLTSRDYAIADDGDFESLEHAFLAGGGPVMLASFEASFVERGTRPADGTMPELTVDRFLGVWPDETCDKGAAEATLVNTTWKIVRLGANDLPAGEARPPQLQLTSPERRFSANVGCNALSGGYVLDGMRLTFDPVAATRMACPPPIADREQRLIGYLGQVAGWRISGEVLELLDRSGAALVMLRAIPAG